MNEVIKLIYYPLKSGAGVSSDFCRGNVNGFKEDRLYCLFDTENKKFVSLRENSRLADLTIVAHSGGLTVSTCHAICDFDEAPVIEDKIKIWSRNVDVYTFPGRVSDFF